MGDEGTDAARNSLLKEGGEAECLLLTIMIATIGTTTSSSVPTRITKYDTGWSTPMKNQYRFKLKAYISEVHFQQTNYHI